MSFRKNWSLQIKFVAILLNFGLMSFSAFAQPEHWEYITGDHITTIPRELPYSENLGMTIHCSQFFHDWGDGYLAGYNGEEWVTLSDTLGNIICGAVDYQVGILIWGGQTFVGTQQMPGMAYYDGNTWSYPWSFNDFVSKLVWANDTLFALGWFTEVDGVSAYRVAKLVGGTWVGVLNPGLFPDSDANLFDLAYYDGNYYIGGGFITADGVQDFARIENGNLVAVEGGPVGANLAIRDMDVYQGELYLAGIIPYAQGNPGNHIIRYDGQTFHGVGAHFFGEQQGVYDISGNVLRIYAKGDYLYAVGYFLYAGDVPMYGVARWDGESWCGMFTNEFLQNESPAYHIIYASGFFQDKLMIYVRYMNDYGTSDPHWLYQGGDTVEACTEPVSVAEVHGSPAIQIFPNPTISGSWLSILIDSRIIEGLRIVDISGRTLYHQSENFLNTANSTRIHLPQLAPGIYLVNLKINGNEFSEKLVIKD